MTSTNWTSNIQMFYQPSVYKSNAWERPTEINSKLTLLAAPTEIIFDEYNSRKSLSLF
jgi:hypothetical protein